MFCSLAYVNELTFNNLINVTSILPQSKQNEEAYNSINKPYKQFIHSALLHTHSAHPFSLATKITHFM